MSTTTAGYVVRKLADAPSVPCPCGISTRPLTVADGGPCSLHVTAITNSERHYHRETTEIYYILEGVGKIELDGDWFEVEPQTTIHIPAGTRHRIVSEQGLRTIVVAIPPFRAEDEYFD